MTRGRDLLARDRASIWHPYTPAGAGPPPLPVVAASGAWIELEGGRRLLDGISSWWTVLHGHRHPALVAALEEQARRLDHVLFAGCTHEPAVALAEALGAALPGDDLTRVFYSDDGSTAVEVALKIARQVALARGQAERRRFVALRGGYHGDTAGAMSVSAREPFFAGYEPLLFPASTFGNLEELDEALDGDPPACAVILEPMVQGAAGMVMWEAGFLAGVRRLCDRHGVLLIADEVMTGFGRTGALFACEHAGIVPDLICLSKGLTGGLMPLGATVVREPIHAACAASEPHRTLYHGHTFTAHPLACAVAHRSLALMGEEGTVERLRALGEAIEAELDPLRGHPRVRDVRRLGGIVAVELDSGQPGYGDPLGAFLRSWFQERGALIRPLGNVVYLMPPACTTRAEAALLARLVREGVAAAP